MKLSKNGWGLKEMIIMTAILFVLLIIVVYYVIVLYNGNFSKKESEYTVLESRLKSAADTYSKSYGKPSIIKLSELKSKGLIQSFKDHNNNDCYGYAVYKSNEYVAYVRCNTYQSRGYNQTNE